LELLKIICGIDIEKTERIIDLDIKHTFRVGLNQFSGADVPFNAHQTIEKTVTENSGIALKPLIDRNTNIFLGPVESGKQQIDNFAIQERLVCKEKHDRRKIVLDV